MFRCCRFEYVATASGFCHWPRCRPCCDAKSTPTTATCHSWSYGCPRWVVPLRRPTIHERTHVRRTRNPCRCPSRRSTAFASVFMTREQVAVLPDADLLAETTEKCGHSVHGYHDLGHHDLGHQTRLQRRLRRAIVLYQRAREGRPSPCRFFPSCSTYALESVEVHGAWRGGWLSLRRVLRCRPLGPSGVDLVPAGPFPTTSCHSCGAGASALPTPLIPTVMSPTQQKGG